MQHDAEPRSIKRFYSSIVSKGAKNGVKEMHPLAIMFPLAVMHPHLLSRKQILSKSPALLVLNEISEYPYRILKVGSSASGKANSLFNLISQQPKCNKIYLYAKDPCEAKYQFLINQPESAGLKHFSDSKAFTEYSNNMNNIYKNIGKYNPTKKPILIPF